MTKAIEFDFYGRKRDPIPGRDVNSEPYVTQNRLRGSLLRMGRRSGPLHQPTQTKTTEQFWNHYSNGSLNIKLFLKDMGVDLQKLQLDSEFVVNSTTECVTLHRNRLGDAGFAILAEKFLRSPNLLHLQVSYNEITDLTLTNFETLFTTNKSLLSLVLCENTFSKVGFQAIANFLKFNTALRVLDLTKTSLDLDGLISLVDGLENNSTLLYLGLRDNELEEDSTKVVCDLISLNGALMFLDLSENVFDIENAKAMLETLRTSNYSIVEIDLSDTDIDEANAEEQKVLDELNKVFLRNIDAPKQALKEALALAKAPWRRTKLMVVGEGRAGKTATVRSLLGMEYNPNWDSTIGAEIIQTKTRTAEGATPWQVMEKADIDDHNKEFLKEILVSEAGNILHTLKNMKNSPAEYKPVRSAEEGGTLLLPKIEEASKIKINDLINTIEDEVTIEASSSQKNQLVLSIWDYGGQKVFYTLHHLFLTKFGIYLIIFDLVQYLRNPKGTEEYLKYWLNSCKLHSDDSPVVLVGTHLDLLDNAPNALKKVQDSLEKMRARKPELFHNILKNEDVWFFAIDNKAQRGVLKLREQIFALALQQKHLNIQVPVFWLNVLDEIFNLNESYVPLEAIINLVVKQTGLKQHNDKSKETTEQDSTLNITKRMLKYFHELGILLYFTSNAVLEDIVILKPQWIIDVLSTIIKDKKLHMKPNKYNKLLPSATAAELEKAGLEAEYKSFYDTAIISQDLLRFLLKSSNCLVNHFRQTTQEVEFQVDLNDFFTSLMKKTLLMSSFPNKDDKEEFYYLIPSLLDVSKKADLAVVTKFEKSTNLYAFQYDFRLNFLPIGLFQRIVCLLLEFLSNDEHTDVLLMTLDNVIIRINSNETVLFRVGEDLIEVIVRIDDAKNKINAFDFVNLILERVKFDVMGKDLQYEIIFFEEKQPVNYADAKEKKLFPFFSFEKAKPVIVELDIDQFLEDF